MAEHPNRYKSRRDFISFLGKATAGAILIPSFLESCGNHNNKISSTPITSEQRKAFAQLNLEGIPASKKDDVVLAPGLESDVLIRWKTPINESEFFGSHNDFTCFVPIKEGVDDDGLLWVNHEEMNPFMISGWRTDSGARPRLKEHVDEEMKHTGGSIIRVKKIDGKWTFIPNDPHNRRIDGKTRIPFNWDAPIAGSDHAIGSHSNCAGGITPWGNFLSCEENYHSFYNHSPEDFLNENNHAERTHYGWDEVYDYPTEHYGWVMEVDPFTGEAQKHVALGRCAHECATLMRLDDGRIVAYTGDDREDECIYKFISSKPDSLKEGTLYVADTVNGKWIPLDINQQEVLQTHFKDQTEVLVRLRKSAALVGGTPQHRPEDIEIDPISGGVIVTLTKHQSNGDYHGSLLKINETEGKYDSLTFTSETMIAGGKETGFTCPDNLIFDLSGNLWFTSDVSGSHMNNLLYPQYLPFKNNSLFVLIRHGEDAGKIIRIASAPTDVEFSGPWFSPDFKTLFLSVQHPGEQSKDLNNPTSTWPHDPDGSPKSAVITIQGPLMDKLNHLRELVES